MADATDVGGAAADRGLEPDEEVERDAERERGAPWVLVGAVAGVALAGMAGTIAFGLAWSHDRGRANDQASARVVAQRFLLDLTNFGPTTVGADFSEMKAMATGRFAAQVRQSFGPQTLRALQAAQARSEGQIQHLYLQTYSGAAAEFYGVVVQAIHNNLSPAVRSGQLRVVIDLSKVAGQWKISQVTTLASGSGSGPTSG